jgi:SH3 domain protein
LILGLAHSLAADTVYVRDTIYVPLRGGQSAEHRILHRGIRSGTALERIQTNDDSGYTQVKMESGGLEGWIQSQYLVDEPIARVRLKQTEGRLLDLEASYQKKLLIQQDIETKQIELSDSNETLQTKNDTLTEELTNLTQLAANVIAIDEENKQLRDEQTKLVEQMDAVSVANQELQSSTDQQWFLRGAGTILIGLLVGFWLSRRIYHKHDSGGWS